MGSSVQINEFPIQRLATAYNIHNQNWENRDLDKYRYGGDVIVGHSPGGDFMVILSLPSEIEELEAASDCLFSRQNSSILTSAIFF